MTNKKTKRIVMITTSHKGVFCGVLESNRGDMAVLTHARMCVYWGTTMRGVMGLAAHGPDRTCKIGPAVARIKLSGVTAVIDVSEEAASKWEAQPWA